MDLPLARRTVALLFTGTLLLPGLHVAGDEPYKRMLDDPLVFTGTETLDGAETQGEYRIGVFAPGDDEHPVGRDLVQGVALAVERANAAGGIDGKPVRMVRGWAEDPWGAGSKEVIRMVFEDRVWALIGGPDGETTHVAQQVATKAHLPLIAPVSSDPSLTHTRVPWIFRLPPDDGAQAEVLVTAGVVSRELTSVGVLVSADHDGRTFATEIKEEMGRARISPVFELTVNPDLPDPGSLADRVKGFAPDAIVMRLRPGGVRRMLAALKSVGVSCAVLLPWIPGLNLVEFPPGYDGSVAEIIPFEPAQQCGPYLKLVRAGVRRHGAEPSAPMVYGYDGANLVIEALRRTTGGRADLQRQLTKLSGFWGASGPIRWDNGGGNTAKPKLQVVTSGDEP